MKKRLKKRLRTEPATPTTVHYEDDMVVLHHGDALKVLRAMPDNSVHSVVTDPPYGLSNTDPKHVAEAVVQWAQGNREYVPHKRGGFMGKEWDSFVPPVAVWDECFRVLKPGGYLLSFAGSRTIDLMTLSIRLAGFDIRDTIMWLYGSGFPKSMDVSKAVDKAAGAERTVPTGVKPGHENFVGRDGYKSVKGDGALSGEGGFARPWMSDPEASERYHQTFAPATPEAAQWDGWGTALKPAHEPIVMARKPHKGTVANNVLEHGAGGLNIDATRIHSHDSQGYEYTVQRMAPGATQNATGKTHFQDGTTFAGRSKDGRWPANIALDEEAAEALDEQSGSGTSRFFYVSKASKKERPVVDGVAHPTVKPVALMRWLVRMVTPPDGVVLDPFVGSGTTLEAAKIEGLRSIGVESWDEYLPLAVERVTRSTVEEPKRPTKSLRKRPGARARMAPPSAR